MSVTNPPPEPTDDAEMLARLKESIKRSIEEIDVHIPTLLTRDTNERDTLLSRLAEQLILEETTRQQYDFPQSLLPTWSQRLIRYAQEKLARYAQLSPLSKVSYTPIPLGID